MFVSVELARYMGELLPSFFVPAVGQPGNRGEYI